MTTTASTSTTRQTSYETMARKFYFATELDIAEGKLSPFISSYQPPHARRHPTHQYVVPAQLPIGCSTDTDDVVVRAKATVGTLKLKVCRTPILEAFLYCAIQGWGAAIVADTADLIRIHVSDFHYCCCCMNYINTRPSQTNDLASRLKALRRWFPDIESQLLVSNDFHLSLARGHQKGNANHARFLRLRIMITRIKAEAQ